MVEKDGGVDKPLIKLMVSSKIDDIRCQRMLREVSNADFIKVNYKVLASEPQRAIDNICGFLKINSYTAPEYMYLDNDHTIGGSPHRFKKRVIKYDASWLDEIKNYPMHDLIAKMLDLF